MILVRHYEPNDETAVRRLHAAQGLDYELPDLSTCCVRTVIEEDGVVTHAALLRKTAEAYWLFAPGASRKNRLGRLLALHRDVERLAKVEGFPNVHCWVKPEIAVTFEPTLLRLGWVKPLWVDFMREVR